MQFGEKQTETEIETEMLVIHLILNQNLDNIHLTGEQPASAANRAV